VFEMFPNGTKGTSQDRERVYRYSIDNKLMSMRKVRT